MASSSRCEAVYVPKKKHFGKKRKKIFHGVRSYELSPAPAPSSKVSIVTGEFQDLELTTKAAKLDDTVESNARYLEFSDAQASASEKKITLSNPGSIEFAEMEIFVVGKDKPIMKSLAKVHGQALIDIGILEVCLADVAVCRYCKKGEFEFYQSSFVNGIAKDYFVICDQCKRSSEFYTLPKSDLYTNCDNNIMFDQNLLQILGERIAGIGKSGLDTINSIIGLPPTLANRAFYAAQKTLSKVSMEMAVRSCNRAAQKLRDIHGKSSEEILQVPVSYDGAYQKRTGKGGGGFARYCFTSAISIETGEVLSFEIACNGCKYCVEKQEALKDKRLSIENYRLWLDEHEKTCQAKEYGHVNSVALESKLAPVVFRKSINQKLLYSTVVADGDDKSVNLLVDLDIYGEFGVVISREECLSHVQKRLRMHLIEKQKEYISSNKVNMANELSKDKKAIRQFYKPITFRDSKLSRNKWDGSDDMEICSEIELLSDAMIDKIVSLYGYTIKSNSHLSLSEIRNLLLAIVFHLSATDENCSEMHKYCPVGEYSWYHYQKVMFFWRLYSNTSKSSFSEV